MAIWYFITLSLAAMGVAPFAILWRGTEISGLPSNCKSTEQHYIALNMALLITFM
jgi:hypothetical protein